MRRFALLTLTLTLLLGSFVNAQVTLNVDVTLYVDEDSLTVYLPETDQPVPMQDFGVFIQGRSAGGVYYLNSYPALGSVDFTAVETPACFRLERFDTAIPLPMACQSNDVSVYVQALADGDVVWYDQSVNQAFTLVLQRGGDVLNDATCPAGNPACTLTYSAIGAVVAERFDDDEVGVVLATFERLSPDAPTVDRDLETQFIANRIDYVRVEDVIDTEAQARDLLNQYNATIVVYGEVEVDDEGAYQTRVRFEVEPRRSEVQTEIDELASASQTLESFESYLLSGMDIFYVLDFIEGQIAYFEDDFETALAFFQRAEANIPAGQEREARADSLYFYLAYTYGTGLNDLQRAVEYYTRVLQLDPDDAAAFFNRGSDHYQLADFEQALADFTSAIDLDFKNEGTYSFRGLTYAALGEYEQAIADYNRAIEINPDHDIAYNNRANTYLDLGEYEQAIADYNRAIELAPEDARGYFNRAFAYETMGDLDRAIDDYTRAIDADPNLAEAYNNRALLLAILGDYEQAVVDYDRAIEIEPEHADYFNNRGVAYVYLGNTGQALADFNRAVELNPDLAEAYGNLGILYDQLGQLDEALDAYRTYAELAGDDADTIVLDRIAELESPVPTPTPTFAGQVQVGDNRGEVMVGGADAWTFNGKAGSKIKITLSANNPANDEGLAERDEDGFDTRVLVYTPDGSLLAENDDIEPGIVTDSRIEDLELPVDGEYTIEVRSWGNASGGAYTLTIEVESAIEIARG